MSDLLVHSGGFETDRSAVEAVPVPTPDASQSRWHPLPYRDFLNTIDIQCREANVPVLWDEARYALAREGKQLFGTVPVGFDMDPDTYRELELTGDLRPMMGFRQSYDQSMAAGLVLGFRVFVCDNMCFSGEFAVSHKNTASVLEELPARLGDAAGKLLHWTHGVAGEVKLMKRIHPSTWEVSHIVCTSVERGILPASKVGQVLGEIETPSYDYSNGNGGGNGDKSLWRIFNAFTTTQRDRSPATQFRTGTPLLNLFREHGLRERRAELTETQRRALQEMEIETAEVLASN